MKQFLFIALIALISACGNKSEESTESTKTDLKTDRLEVYAFHGTRQCETCKHMKAYTKSTLNKYFKDELNAGTVVYQVVDVDDGKNFKIAEKFEATGTALMINKIKNGKENIEDWSDFAFEYANGEKAAYEKELKKMIDAQLK
jgi:hypothetical protein